MGRSRRLGWGARGGVRRDHPSLLRRGLGRGQANSPEKFFFHLQWHVFVNSKHNFCPALASKMLIFCLKWQFADLPSRLLPSVL